MNRFAMCLVAFVMVFGGSYLKGYRIITLEEIPNSHRPGGIFLSADYGKQHLSEEPDYLSQLGMK